MRGDCMSYSWRYLRDRSQSTHDQLKTRTGWRWAMRSTCGMMLRGCLLLHEGKTRQPGVNMGTERMVLSLGADFIDGVSFRGSAAVSEDITPMCKNT